MLAESAGLVLDPWQAWVLDEALGERDDGRWAAFEVGLCCPRQNGKSAVLEAVMLGALFLDGGETVYSAHEFKTAQKIWRRLDHMIQGTPELKALVKRRVTSTNEMGLELFDGSLLQFVARSGASGRGFSADRLIFDEAMILSAESMGAMIPTMSAKPNGQVWYAGSAGQGDSDHWRSIRDRGRSGNSAARLAWFEWGGEPVEDIRSRSAWAARNPGFPDRLTDEALEAELETLETRAETLHEWRRERLGVWDDPDSESRAIPAAVWKSCQRATTIASSLVFGVDVSPKQDWAAIGVSGLNDDGHTHLEVTGIKGQVDHRPGTDWLVPRLVQLCKVRDAAVAVAKDSNADALIPDLEAAGVDVIEIPSAEMKTACASLLDLATSGRLAHLGQPALDLAVANTKRRDIGDGAWAYSRKTSADITPLYACTLAAWALTKIDGDLASNVW